MKDRQLSFFLIISAFIHSLIFVHFNGIDLTPPAQKLKKIEVTYYKLKNDLTILKRTVGNLEKIANLEGISEEKRRLQEISEKFAQGKKLANLANIDKSLDKPLFQVQEPKTQALDTKKILIPPLVELQKDYKLIPGFKNYYNAIRSKIKQKAYQNFLGSEEGVIYLSFIITADGQLKDIKIIEDKSAESRYLKKIALQSIKLASPYPEFPKEINLKELSFKLPISFKIR